MAYAFTGIWPEPVIEYDVMDAASQAPFRVTIASGAFGLGFDHGKVRMDRQGDPREPMGFFVPNLQPLANGPDPLILAEVALTQVAVHIHNAIATHLHGIGSVQTQIGGDPARGGQRCVYLSFAAIGQDAIGARYRLTVYRPR